MQTMNSHRPGPPALSLRFLLTIIAAAMVTGLLLTFLDPPIWVFWIAPIVIGPFMLHEVRTQKSKSDPRKT